MGAAPSWRHRAGDATEREDEDSDDEDEDDARLSETDLLEDEDSWDAEEDEGLYWFDEDEEEGKDLRGTDSF